MTAPASSRVRWIVLAIVVVAMRAGVGLKDLSGTIHAYPTYAEIARRAADRYQRSRLTPRTKALFEWLYRRARRT